MRQRRDGPVTCGIPAPHGKSRDRANGEYNHQRNEHKCFDAPPQCADLQENDAGRLGENEGGHVTFTCPPKLEERRNSVSANLAKTKRRDAKVAMP